jgi:hypothetical protein
MNRANQRLCTSNRGFGLNSDSIWNPERCLADIELARCVEEGALGLGGNDNWDHDFQSCNLIHLVLSIEPRAENGLE